MLGDGHDGDLYISNGQTVALNLDTKYQFKNITIEAGGTLTTNSGAGSVLYLCATGAVNISGNIALAGRVARGQNSWSVAIDGTTYSSPSTGQGGGGGYWSGMGATQGQNGYGAGGAGGSIVSSSPGFTLRTDGGWGNSGVYGGGGASSFAGNNAGSSGTSANNGGAGGPSGGGGGGSWAYWTAASGSGVINVWGYGGGGGGGNYGNGGGGGANPAGRVEATANPGQTLSYSYSFGGLGGGGAGGFPGQPGVHLVIRGSEVNLLSGGNIDLSGTGGQGGGSGGPGYSQNGAFGTGLGGGGGGGGRGGNAYIYWGTKLTNTIGWNRAGGAGGGAGNSAASGANGATGTLTTGRNGAWYGNMLTMFQ